MRARAGQKPPVEGISSGDGVWRALLCGNKSFTTWASPNAIKSAIEDWACEGLPVRKIMALEVSGGGPSAWLVPFWGGPPESWEAPPPLMIFLAVVLAVASCYVAHFLPWGWQWLPFLLPVPVMGASRSRTSPERGDGFGGLCLVGDPPARNLRTNARSALL